jgi:hypothetical protein
VRIYVNCGGVKFFVAELTRGEDYDERVVLLAEGSVERTLERHFENRTLLALDDEQIAAEVVAVVRDLPNYPRFTSPSESVGVVVRRWQVTPRCGGPVEPELLELLAKLTEGEKRALIWELIKAADFEMGAEMEAAEHYLQAFILHPEEYQNIPGPAIVRGRPRPFAYGGYP